VTIPSDTVTGNPGSITFVDDYSPNVTSLVEQGVIQGERSLANVLGGADVIEVSVNFAPLGPGVAAENGFPTVNVSYGQFVAALKALATTSDQQIAVAGLPATDPSGGAGFDLPVAYAHHLGLAPAQSGPEISITLNSSLNWSTPTEIAGAVAHELSEGGLGRIGSLGIGDRGPGWAPMDLFRFTASGARDYTGGNDGVRTYFGLDAGHVSNMAYDFALDGSGVDTGRDLADWATWVQNDDFGPGGPGWSQILTSTDLQVLRALGWGPPVAPPPPVPSGDDWANSLGDATHPVGLFANPTPFLTTETVSGFINYLGDHDVFAAHLLPGVTYEVTLDYGPPQGVVYQQLTTPSARLMDSTGATVAQLGPSPTPGYGTSTFYFATPQTTDGAYYLDVGALNDQSKGGYSAKLEAVGVNIPSAVASAMSYVLDEYCQDSGNLALSSQISVALSNGSMTQSQAIDAVVRFAAATSSVATMTYQYFTGATPSFSGLNYLVSPEGPNPNNLNSAYYQSFSLENRYINFAVNLGSGQGQGAGAFAQAHGSETLAQTLSSAYAVIFGTAPTADKVSGLLDAQVTPSGHTMSRADYFALYGGDGANGIGTKAAMVGWLLAEAVKADVGTYALSNDALLHEAATTNHNMPYGVDMIGHYSTPSMAYLGG
jgi:hypothetical protein